MFILWNHMVTTKHKRRSLVPLSLPTSQPHPGTSYYWFSRLQGLRIIAMNHRRVISKYPKSPNFRAPNEKKHQMFLSKKLFFSKWGKGISFWPRDKTQWSSVLASSTLVVVKRTCENPGELSTHPTEGTVRGDVFFSQRKLSQEFLLLAKEPAMESEETSQQATSQLWQNLTKDLYLQAGCHYWQPTQTMHGFLCLICKSLKMTIHDLHDVWFEPILRNIWWSLLRCESEWCVGSLIGFEVVSWYMEVVAL